MKKKNEDLIEQFSKTNNILFNDNDLLRNAFVHRSYLNENPGFTLESNERLEFLGDAVLELVVTEFLFHKFTSKPEGELTALRSALVRGKNLSEIAETLGVYECLYLSIGERSANNKAKSLILANALEAIIGAIYLDLGIDSVKKFISKNILEGIDEVISSKLYVDSKSEFQEKVQERFKHTPYYKVMSEIGPDHNKVFTSGVYIDKDFIAQGEGSSKNIAEQEAAKAALEKLF